MNTVNTEDRSDEQVVARIVAAKTHRWVHADTLAPHVEQWHRDTAAAVLAALTAAGRLRAPAAAADDDEQTARSIFRAWLEHCGYTAEQITEIDAERDHSKCDMTDDGWGDCTDADGESNHRLHNETQEAADLIMFTLEALAGRLLPEGGETFDCYRTAERDCCILAGGSGNYVHVRPTARHTHVQSRTQYPNGWELLGPWVEVPTTEGDAGHGQP